MAKKKTLIPHVQRRPKAAAPEPGRPENVLHSLADSAKPSMREAYARGELQMIDGLCLIDIGGGLRGMFAAGVLDGFLDLGILAGLCIGVSAGSANLATYLALQPQRCYTYYHDYAFRQEYASMHNFVSKHSFFDFDYIYSTLTNSDGEYPIDYEQMMATPARMISVATNALTGRPAYFDKDRIRQDDYAVFKASCSVPFLCTTNTVAGIPYADGTVSDPIPIDKALELGAKKIVILASRDLQPLKDQPSAEIMRQAAVFTRYGREYPAITQALARRNQVHNRSLETVRRLEKEGRALVIYPQDTYSVHALGGSQRQLEHLYEEGKRSGLQILEFLGLDEIVEV